MSTASDPQLQRLSGLMEIGAHPNDASLHVAIGSLQAVGFADAYLGDIFLEVAPRHQVDPHRLVFDEGDSVLQFRPAEVYDMVRAALSAAGLSAESAHYNQILPPPGSYPCAWLWDYHTRMVDVAARLGLQRVTTHPGWMFGSAMDAHIGAAAKAYRDGRSSQTDLNRTAFACYGGDAVVWRDSVEIYRRLCDRAGEAGLNVTIETAVSEWYELTLHAERLHAFCDAVGAPNLGICVDSGHCHLNGVDVATMIRACGERMWETHFHDNYGERDEHNPVGDGTIDWPSVIQALRGISYKSVITFEQCDHEINSTRWRAWVDE